MLKQALLDGDKTSFGRVASIPFLTSALGLQVWEGIAHIRAGESVIDAVITLAMIGMALFTGSKVLSARGSKANISLGTAPPGEADAA